MQHLNTAILIVTALLGIGTLFKVFQFDVHYQDIKASMQETETALNTAMATNARAKEQLQQLRQRVSSYELKNQLLSAQRDSLILSRERQSAKDWEDLGQIKQAQEENAYNIKKLREKDREFE